MSPFHLPIRPGRGALRALLAALLFALLGWPGTPGRAAPRQVIAPVLARALAAQPAAGNSSVLVILREQHDPRASAGRTRRERRQALVADLRAKADRTQAGMRARLRQLRGEGRVSAFTPLWVVNAVAVTADAATIQALAARPEVASIVPDGAVAQAPPPAPAGAPEPNLSAVGAPELWALGLRGQGVVIASLDSGVDAGHPDLAPRYRGGSNSWFDPYGQHAAPYDASGHGTQIMGVMVGGDVGGSTIGVAPQATWIAAKIFNDSGAATTSAIHQAFQWVLDPDGNPATDDAPDLVNNSWALGSPGCDLSFAADLQALVAAGITPVFAAGNHGPASPSDTSPANNPGALAVGAVTNGGAVLTQSGRGPTTCGRAAPATFPDLVAPGSNIYTSDLFGLYYTPSGTSLAAPHVTGGLALLLSAFPGLSVEQQRAALLVGAADLGAAGADSSYGAGRLDLAAAYAALAGGPSPTATPVSPTATPLPPTATPVPPTATPAPPTATPLPPTATPALPTATPAPVAGLFSDGFESGGLGAWAASATAGGKLGASPAAALAGAYGLRAEIASTKAMYVADRSPAAEAAYRARFAFDLNSVTMSSGKVHTLFLGINGAGEQLFATQLRFNAGAYQVRGTLRTNGGALVATGWHTVGDAPHTLEIHWQAATTAAAGDGALSLWVDGQLKQTRGGVANGQLRLEEVRLGPTGLSAGISGVEYYDAFVSSRGAPLAP